MVLETIKNKDGRLILAKGVFRSFSMEEIINEIHLQNETITIFGNTLPVPRLVDYQGELGYKYSGTNHPAKLFSPKSKQILEEVQYMADFRFNSILFNYYENGEDYMGYHKDNEKNIDSSYIASVSLGTTRKFNCKHQDGELFSVNLKHGDLLIMDNFQTHWKHALPKSSKIKEPRLNLTFRKIIA